MSAAFVTIERELLLEILEPIIQEDEMRLKQFLLRNTQINIKVNGATQKLPLQQRWNISGDSLSPILFMVYVEHALREVRSIIPNWMQNIIIFQEKLYIRRLGAITL